MLDGGAESPARPLVQSAQEVAPMPSCRRFSRQWESGISTCLGTEAERRVAGLK